MDRLVVIATDCSSWKKWKWKEDLRKSKWNDGERNADRKGGFERCVWEETQEGSKGTPQLGVSSSAPAPADGWTDTSKSTVARWGQGIGTNFEQPSKP